MGLFDFFRKKPIEPQPPELQPPEPLEGVEPSIHYELAHYALRGIALQDPLSYLSLLASPRARDFLQDVLNDIRKELPGAQGFAADELHIHTDVIGGFPCAIIEFPPPAEITEAYFTALLAFVDLERDLPPPEEVRARYITLEKGAGEAGRPRTVLCEWTMGSHLNYGDGPSPTLHGFMAAIERLVATFS